MPEWSGAASGSHAEIVLHTIGSEPDIDRLLALYRFGVVDGGGDPFLDAVVQKVSAAFTGMAVQAVLVDDHRLWVAASAGSALDERGKQGSLAAAAIEQVEPMVIDDLAKESRFSNSPSIVDAPALRSYAAVSLRTPDGLAIGVLAASDTVARAFQPDHVEVLIRGAAHIMERLDTRRVARLDEATGAMTKTAFCEQASAMAALAARHKRDLSLLAIEVGLLRLLLQSFRDDLGQLVIDRVGGIGRNNVRRVDSFGRLDEGTFAVLLPNTDEAGARSLGRRVLDGLAEGWLFSAKDGGSTAPAGVGIATFRPGLDNAETFIARALDDCRMSWLRDTAEAPSAVKVA